MEQNGDVEDTNDSHNSDGLEPYYDLIIQGTGLVQSIISCAAARIGKRVLHLDPNEYYGEEFASFTLRSLSHYQQNLREVGLQDIDKDSLGNTSYNNDSKPVLVYEYRHPAVRKFESGQRLEKMTMNPRKHNPACCNMLMMRDSVAAESNSSSASRKHPVFQGYTAFLEDSLERIVSEDRRFTLDLNCRLLYGSGAVVNFFIASDVARYLEFKNISGLYFWAGDEDPKVDDVLWRVPSSKVDVFNSKMLTALEKRALMKFHQFVADWGRDLNGSEVTTLNERDMGVGRSLYRPQNKEKMKNEYDWESFTDRPFTEFLQHCKISSKLQNVIVYALCGYFNPIATTGTVRNGSSWYTSKEALPDMFRHLDSLSRYGRSAFLVPLYGTGEVVQAFCRMSAVWGTTFILRRKILTVNRSEEALSQDKLEGADVDTKQVGEGNNVLTVRDDAGNSIQCGAFATSALTWSGASLSKSKFTLTAISIWSGKPFVECPGMIVVPPNAKFQSNGENQSFCSLHNSCAIHIIIQGEESSVVPRGSFTMHITTTFIDPNRSHDDVSWHSHAYAYKDFAVELVDNLCTMLKSCEDLSGNDELYRSVTIWPVTDRSIPSPSLVDNIVVLPSLEQSISFDMAFNDAEVAFRQIFPGEDFSLTNAAPPPNTFQNSSFDEETAFLEATLDAVSSASINTPDLHQDT